MKILIDLFAGAGHTSPIKEDVDKNIQALDRAINGTSQACDGNYLLDTKSILELIRKQLPER